jgi:hypothetical protein
MKSPDAANVGHGTEKIVPDPNLKASPNLPNAHAPLEVVSGRPDSPSAGNPARPKPRPYWATVWGPWRGCKWLALAFSSFKSTCGHWASSSLNVLHHFGITRRLNRFAKPLRSLSKGRIGLCSRSVKPITLFTHTCSHTKPRPVRLGPSQSPIFKTVSSTWRSHLSHTMPSRLKANTCEPLEPQSWWAGGCPASRGLVGFRALYKIKSVSFGRAS